MKDVQHLLSFDLFQQVVFWLSVSTRACRKGRIYLENNPALLQIESDRELERLVLAHAEEQIEMKQQMSYHLDLLRDARRRGGTTSAIRTAYTNLFGGFALDIPAWLEEVERHRLFLLHLQRPERTNKAYCQLLQHVIAKAVKDQNIAPETIAELQNELGILLVQSTYYTSQQARIQAFETAINCHEAALHVFDQQRYPLQYAKTCRCLGLAYQRYAHIGYKDAQERAITCFDTALHIYSQYQQPEQLALTLTALGNAHTQMTTSIEHLQFALNFHELALNALSNADVSPLNTAVIQVNLGDTYLRSTFKGVEQSRKQAMTCYKAALQIYSQQRFPKEWADIHMRLATIFQYYAEENKARGDLYLRCAIVCCEEALNIYSVDTAPVEYAATYVNLGHLHRQRSGGNRLENLEAACQCYRNALRIFTRQAFPAECRMLLTCLGNAETQRQEHLEHPEAPLCTPAPA